MPENGESPASRRQAVRDRYKLCPSCGNFSAYSSRGEFCIVCGEKLIDQCPHCREPILYPTAKFCPVCGTSLVSVNEEDAKHGA